MTNANKLYPAEKHVQHIAPLHTREKRYRLAGDFMVANGLKNFDTIVDVGAGWQDFDYVLRFEYMWRGIYLPVDHMYGDDLNSWHPTREVDWFVCLEILEHLTTGGWLVEMMKNMARKGIVVTTPDPATVDVLGMDPGHVRAITAEELNGWGFDTTTVSIYTEDYTREATDAIFATWLKD